MEGKRDTARDSQEKFAWANALPVAPFSTDYQEGTHYQQRKPEPPNCDYERIGTRETDEWTSYRDP
jgi:hypothetical protein